MEAVLLRSWVKEKLGVSKVQMDMERSACKDFILVPCLRASPLLSSGPSEFLLSIRKALVFFI